jgi:hypothetical protein
MNTPAVEDGFTLTQMATTNADSNRRHPDLERINAKGARQVTRPLIFRGSDPGRAYFAGAEKPGTRIQFRRGAYVVADGGNLVRLF